MSHYLLEDVTMLWHATSHDPDWNQLHRTLDDLPPAAIQTFLDDYSNPDWGLSELHTAIDDLELAWNGLDGTDVAHIYIGPIHLMCIDRYADANTGVTIIDELLPRDAYTFYRFPLPNPTSGTHQGWS